jgi:hypothetical protein
VESLSSRQQIIDRIQIAGSKSPSGLQPQLIAVSKFQSDETIKVAYQEGQRIFGENYVQELLEKSSRLLPELSEIEFHFIGRLQTNKVKSLLPHVTTIHSVDSLRLLQEIEKRAVALKKKIRVFFQVNIDHEETKGGFLEEDLIELSNLVPEMKWIVPAGLMAIPDPDRDPARAFEKMAMLSGRFGKTLGPGLSMGMSSDFELAISHGATHIRIGSALFGERPKLPGA